MDFNKFTGKRLLQAGLFSGLITITFSLISIDKFIINVGDTIIDIPIPPKVYPDGITETGGVAEPLIGEETNQPIINDKDKNTTQETIIQPSISSSSMEKPTSSEQYFDIALKKYKSNSNDVEALDYFHKAAESENIDAYYYLGLMYTYGNDMIKNATKGTQNFMFAATHNHLDAQYELGLSYLRSRGIEKDKSKGLEWLQKAADQGHLLAKRELKRIY